MKKPFLFIFSSIYLLLLGVKCDIQHYSFLEEIFGQGLSENQVNKEAKRHLASSTEDLKKSERSKFDWKIL